MNLKKSKIQNLVQRTIHLWWTKSKTKYICHLSFEIGHFSRSEGGFSLVEMLIVTVIFSILALVTTSSVLHSLRGSRKSEFLGVVRSEVDYSASILERNLRSAQNLDCVTSTPSRLNYTDEWGKSAYFECITSGIDTYIASNSAIARLTSQDVRITNCASIFVCTKGVSGTTDYITIQISAIDSKGAGLEGGQVTSNSRVLLRSY